jgi:hypothetical protein
MTFHDPTVGSDGMLIGAAQYYREGQRTEAQELIKVLTSRKIKRKYYIFDLSIKNP